jgi:hypothetical protein
VGLIFLGCRRDHRQAGRAKPGHRPLSAVETNVYKLVNQRLRAYVCEPLQHGQARINQAHAIDGNFFKLICLSNRFCMAEGALARFPVELTGGDHYDATALQATTQSKILPGIRVGIPLNSLCINPLQFSFPLPFGEGLLIEGFCVADGRKEAEVIEGLRNAGIRVQACCFRARFGGGIWQVVSTAAANPNFRGPSYPVNW